MSTIQALALLPVVGQPRYSKRIAMLQEHGLSVSAVAFERNYHKGRLPNCSLQILGKIKHGSYLRRVLTFVRALPKLRSEARKADFVYAWGPDMACYALFATMGLKKPVVVEIGDIRKIQLAKSLRGLIVRVCERFFVERYALLVSTSQGFIDGYYRSMLGSRISAMVIENKMERDAFPDGIPAFAAPSTKEKLVIGYFGLLRCKWSWDILKRLAQDGFEIILAGYPMGIPELKKGAMSLPSGMRYLGEYASPTDLPTLYREVDVVWASYPHDSSGNMQEKWARTNRFYESCFFKKPIITRHGSSDGDVVEKYGIGYCICETDIERAANELKAAIRRENILKWGERMETLPISEYVYTNEGARLADALQRVVNKP